MKRTIIAAIVGIGFAGTAMAADPAVGVWKTQLDVPRRVSACQMNPLWWGDLRYDSADVQRVGRI